MVSAQSSRAPVNLRRGQPADAKACAQICYDAFGTIAAAHNFPSDFPSVELAHGLMTMLLSHPGFYSVVAEVEDEIVGSNFLDERSPIAGLGPITIAPNIQNRKIGRQLMEAAMLRATDRGAAGVRLLQAAYHTRSLALYAGLGFQVREAIACMQGRPVAVTVAGYDVRRARAGDLDACNRVCRQVHGHDRGGELLDGIRQGTATVVEHDGRITGYATDLAYFAHAVGETNRELIALIGAAAAFGGPGILVPLRNGALFQWCLSQGLRVVHVMTLMTVGLYNEPTGGYLPSVLY